MSGRTGGSALSIFPKNRKETILRALDSETLSEIPVVMAFDKGYLLPSCTAVLSLLEKMNPAFCCHLYILAEEKDRDMDEGLFRAFAERFPSFSWNTGTSRRGASFIPGCRWASSAICASPG